VKSNASATPEQNSSLKPVIYDFFAARILTQIKCRDEN
jgi:hypothetical protein